MKPKIKIADTQFAHTPGGSLGTGDLCIPPSYFEWYRGNENINDLVVVTESCFHLVDRMKEKIKIAWLIEPPLINSKSYEWISKPQNYSKFNYVLTYNMDILNIDERFRWYVFGGCWIKPHEQKVYEKSKLISIIASGKRITAGHRLRHEVIERLEGKVDVYGNGYKYVENKLEALKDYMYSIVIENDPCSGFYSEKLIDCFRTGTIPVFWGDEKIVNQRFNPEGICFFGSADDLVDRIDGLDKEYYSKRLIQVGMNFIGAEYDTIPEDALWKSFFKPKFFNT